MHSVSVNTDTVDSGAQIKIRYAVKNTGTATCRQRDRLRISSHILQPAPRRQGGDTGRHLCHAVNPRPRAAGSADATNIKTPSVSGDTVIYYYVCISAAEGETQTDDNCGHVTVTVKGKAEVAETPVEEPETPAEEPEEEEVTEEPAPNLVMYSVSVTPEETDAGASIKLRYGVKNTGTATASEEAVSIYRHTSATNTPETGTRVARLDVLSLGERNGITRTKDDTAPSPSSDTTYYYYACVSTADGEETNRRQLRRSRRTQGEGEGAGNTC